jgi:hypothetical protein
MMRRALPRFLALAFFVPLLSPGAATGASPESGATAAGPKRPPLATAAAWIDRANRALLPAGSLDATARLTTRDGYGDESVDVIRMVRGVVDGAERTLVQVERDPMDAGGAVYEVVAKPGEPLDRWIWLPSVRRLRHVTGVQRTDSFLGTEFSYEDLGLALPKERRWGEVSWVDDESGGPSLVEVESPPYHYYSRVVTLINPETSLPVQVRFYDRSDQLFHEETFDDVRTIDGHPFPMRIRMWDPLTGAESVLQFQKVEVGKEIPARVFEDSVIRRRLAAAAPVVPPQP